MAEENEIYLEDDLGEMGENSRITVEQVEAVVESIDKKLAANPDDKVLKKKAKEFKKRYPSQKAEIRRILCLI